jgi:hypothetical protein
MSLSAWQAAGHLPKKEEECGEPWTLVQSARWLVGVMVLMDETLEDFL